MHNLYINLKNKNMQKKWTDISLNRKEQWMNIKQDVYLISNKKRYHFTPIWLPILKKSDTAIYWPENGPVRTHIASGDLNWNNYLSYFCKVDFVNTLQSSNSTTMYWPYRYLAHVYQETCLRKFSSAIFSSTHLETIQVIIHQHRINK